MFNAIDSNQDDVVDLDELLKFLYALNDIDYAMHANAIFEKADVDKSGYIDFDEFCHYMVSLKYEHIEDFHNIIEAFGGGSNNKLSQWLLAPLKLLSIFMPDILLSALFVSWLNMLNKDLRGSTGESIPVIYTAKTIMMSPFAVRSRSEREEWKQHQKNNLPNYFVSCCLIYNEIYGYLVGHLDRIDLTRNLETALKSLLSGICIFLTVTGISHLLTQRGRLIWKIVFKKYFTFILACIGVWNDDVMDCYELEQLSDLSLKEGKKNIDLLDLISLTIGPRAILLQIIPFGAFLSIFAITCSSTPIVLLSERAKEYFPSLFMSDAMDRARENELESGRHTLPAEDRGTLWVVKLKSWGVYTSHSRFFSIIQALFQFSMTVGILYTDPYTWLILSFIVFVPMITASALEVFVLTGHFFGVTDDDFVSFFVFPLALAASGSTRVQLYDNNEEL